MKSPKDGAAESKKLLGAESDDGSDDKAGKSVVTGSQKTAKKKRIFRFGKRKPTVSKPSAGLAI